MRAGTSLLLLGACLGGIACTSKPAAKPRVTASAPEAPAPTPPGLPKSDRELPTTSANIFFGNLRGQIEVHRESIRRDPPSALAHRDLASLLYVLARHDGELDGIQGAIDEVSRAIELDPTEPTLYLMRAQQVQSLHRFDAAQADLAWARTLGASAQSIDAVTGELDYSQGRYDTAIPAIRRAAAETPTMRTVGRLALLEHDLGHAAAAEHAFHEAERLVRDSNPIPVAWLNLQRGHAALQDGDPERAVVFLREAVRRTPGYVAAEEHLAEALAASGHADEAIALYESIATRSGDPEFKAALAALYRARGQLAEADALAARAKHDYERLIEQYPEAMAAHATEFFLEEGRDPHRALELATRDVHLRPTAHAYTSLARAQLANGNPVAARVAIDRALAMPAKLAEVPATAALVADALAPTTR